MRDKNIKLMLETMNERLRKLENEISVLRDIRDKYTESVASQHQEPPLDSILVDGDGFAWQRHRLGWCMVGCDDMLDWSQFLEESMCQYEIVSTEKRIDRAVA